MGRNAIKSSGNVWRKARIEAAKGDGRFSNRENVADMANTCLDSIRRLETGEHKVVPVELAMILAQLYNAPELENYYCVHECPLGRDRPVATEVYGIEQVTVQLLRELQQKYLEPLKEELLDIAEDGVIDESELPCLDEIVKYLDKVTLLASELKVLARRTNHGAYDTSR